MSKGHGEVGLIVAMSEGGVIGSNGDLPWRLPDDLKHFKATTLGHCLIMGRKTWDSLPGALPGRTAIVVTRNAKLEVPGAELANSIGTALALAGAKGDDAPIIAGGAEIYALALPFVRRMWITRVHAEISGDVVFPAWNPDGWECVRDAKHDADARHAHAFSIEEWTRG